MTFEEQVERIGIKIEEVLEGEGKNGLAILGAMLNMISYFCVRSELTKEQLMQMIDETYEQHLKWMREKDGNPQLP